MRIVAGSLKGRIIHDPTGHHAHPMSEKARGALFNVLGDISDLTLLDAMAGSGALSFEAISRGSKAVTAIESKRSTYKTAEKSLKELAISDKVKMINADAGSWSSRNTDKLYDVVLLDPPYQDLQINLLTRLTYHAKKNGIIVVSWPGRQQPPAFDGAKLLMDKKYGDIQLVFYSRIK